MSGSVKCAFAQGVEKGRLRSLRRVLGRAGFHGVLLGYVIWGPGWWWGPRLLIVVIVALIIGAIVTRPAARRS